MGNGGSKEGDLISETSSVDAPISKQERRRSVLPDDDDDDMQQKIFAKYLGSCVVMKLDSSTVPDSVERVKQMKQPARSIVLTASAKTLQVDSQETLEIITSVPAENLVLVQADPFDKKMLACISYDKATGIRVCHVFALKDSAKPMADDITKLMNIKPSTTAASPLPSQADSAEPVPTDLPLKVFKAMYLGKEAIRAPHPHGQQEVQTALVSLKDGMKRKMKKILLTISVEGLQFLDTSTNAIIYSAKIAEISFCSIDKSNKKIVAFVTSDPDLTVHCHAVMVKKRAIDINLAVGAVFAVVAEQVKRSGNAKSAIRALTLKGAPAQSSNDEGGDRNRSASFKLSEESARLAAKGDEPMTRQQREQGGAALGIYEAQWLGNTLTSEDKGQAIAVDATHTVLSANKDPTLVVIVMSVEGLKVTEALSADVLSTTPIKNVS